MKWAYVLVVLVVHVAGYSRDLSLHVMEMFALVCSTRCLLAVLSAEDYTHVLVERFSYCH